MGNLARWFKMNRRLARCLVYLTFLLGSAPGCQALHVYRPVTVQVRDAETKKPIPGAEVRLSYPLADASFAPWQAVGMSGSDGIAQLRAAPYGEAGILLDVTIPSYMTEQKSFSTEAVAAIKPTGFLESAGQRPVSFVVEMYAEPFPEVELVVPDGFRGTVKVAINIQDDAPHTPGQRLFSYVVPPSGTLQVTGPTLLRRVYAPDFRARYANGTPINRQPLGDEVGFLSLKTEGGFDYFLIGTRAELEELRRADQRDQNGSNRSSGGKGGGKGGGRRGGGGVGGGRGGNQSSSSDTSQSSVSPQ
jgi:uncharacterized membrane protein YgcG